MAYTDPYAQQHGRYDQQYTEPTFNPYNIDNTQPHQAYDQGGYDSYGAGGYRDDDRYGQSVNPGAPTSVPGPRKLESTPYDQGGFAQAATGNRSRDLRRWRHETHGALWTKGSRGACIGRFCCCTLMIVVFILVSILLPLVLWTRPPNIIVGNVQPVTTGSEIQLLSNGVQINLQIPIYVSNPNYFTVSFSSIKANIYYPINNTYIGGGQENGVTFPAHSSENITFPFSIQYTTNMTSSTAIIQSLETKCGVGGGAMSDITVNYDITLGLRVLFFTVSPTISSSASFLCPLSAAEIASLTSAIPGGASGGG